MNPPYFHHGVAPTGQLPAYNVQKRLSDLEFDNRRLTLAASELEQKLHFSWDQMKDFHAIAEKAAAENDMMKQEAAVMLVGKRKMEDELTSTRAGRQKLEDELKGVHIENARLQRVAQASDARREKADADAQQAKAECARQTTLAQRAQTELSEIRVAAESVKLHRDNLSASLKHATASNKALRNEVLELKGRRQTAKEDTESKAKLVKLQAKYDEVAKKFAEVSSKYEEQAPQAKAKLQAECNALARENRRLLSKLAKAEAVGKERAARLAKIVTLAQGGAKTVGGE